MRALVPRIVRRGLVRPHPPLCAGPPHNGFEVEARAGSRPVFCLSGKKILRVAGWSLDFTSSRDKPGLLERMHEDQRGSNRKTHNQYFCHLC